MIRSRPALALAIVALAWGSIGVVVRQVHLPAVVIAGSRCWLGAACLALVRVHRRRHAVATGVVTAAAADASGASPSPRRSSRLPPIVAVALGLLLAVHWLALVGAQQRAPIGTVLLITYFAPVIATVLAPKVLGEIVPIRSIGALGLSLAGIAFLVRPAHGSGTGIVLAIVAAVTYALMILGLKLTVRDVDPLTLTHVQLTIAGIALVAPAAVAQWGTPSWRWLWLVVLGVLLTGATQTLFVGLLGRLPVSTAGVLTCLEPVSAIVFAWTFLDERPSVATGVGGTAVLVAAMMVATAPRPAPTTSEAGVVR